MIIANITELKLVVDGENKLLNAKFDITREQLEAKIEDKDQDWAELDIAPKDYVYNEEGYAPDPNDEGVVVLNFTNGVYNSEDDELIDIQWVITDDQFSNINKTEIRAGLYIRGMNEWIINPEDNKVFNMPYTYDKKEFHFAKLQLLTSFCSTCLDKHQLKKILLCCFKEQLFNTAMGNELWEDAASIMTDLRRLLEMNEQRTCCTKNHAGYCPTCRTCCQAKSHCQTCCNGMCSL